MTVPEKEHCHLDGASGRADLFAWADSRGIKVYQRSKTVWIAAGRYREREYVVKGRSPTIAVSLWIEGARYMGARPPR
jgi:hypothetical protein